MGKNSLCRSSLGHTSQPISYELLSSLLAPSLAWRPPCRWGRGVACQEHHGDSRWSLRMYSSDDQRVKMHPTDQIINNIKIVRDSVIGHFFNKITVPHRCGKNSVEEGWTSKWWSDPSWERFDSVDRRRAQRCCTHPVERCACTNSHRCFALSAAFPKPTIQRHQLKL